MKRGWRNFWITCGVVAGIGCVCLVSGKVMGATLTVMDNYIPDWIGPGRGEVDVSYDYGDTPLEADTDETYYDVRSLKLFMSRSLGVPGRASKCRQRTFTPP